MPSSSAIPLRVQADRPPASRVDARQRFEVRADFAEAGVVGTEAFLDETAPPWLVGAHPSTERARHQCSCARRLREPSPVRGALRKSGPASPRARLIRGRVSCARTRSATPSCLLSGWAILTDSGGVTQYPRRGVHSSNGPDHGLIAHRPWAADGGDGPTRHLAARESSIRSTREVKPRCFFDAALRARSRSRSGGFG